MILYGYDIYICDIQLWKGLSNKKEDAKIYIKEIRNRRRKKYILKKKIRMDSSICKTKIKNFLKMKM